MGVSGVQQNDIHVPVTLTDRLRAWFKWVVDPLGKFFLGLCGYICTSKDYLVIMFVLSHDLI